jgi:hypothetical protein
MDIPSIDPIEPIPVRGAAETGAVYRAKVDSFTGEDGLPRAIVQWNAAIEVANENFGLVSDESTAATEASAITQAIYDYQVAQNLGGFTGASTTAVTIGTGAKSFTLPAGKLWAKDQAVQIYSSASPGNYMAGRVVSYNRTSGALDVFVHTAEGSGSFSSWLVVPMGPRSAAAPNSVTGTKTDTATMTSTTWVDTGLEATITLRDPESRVSLDTMVQATTSGGTATLGFRITRNGAPILQGDAAGTRTRALMALSGQSLVHATSATGSAIDTPGSIGPHTYKVQWIISAGTGYLNRGATDSDLAGHYRTASTLTASETAP